MDSRNLAALGMLLALVALALLKGSIEGDDVKEIVIFLSGGIVGVTVPRRHDTAKPGAAPPSNGAAMLALLVGCVLLLATCATAPTRCNPVMVQCNPADYPPLTAMLPQSPFPSLLQPIDGGVP